MKLAVHRAYPLWLLLPGTAIYFIFFIVPSLVGIYFSFFNWDFFSAKFVGANNYVTFFTDAEFSISIKNSFLFALLTTVLKMTIGFALALILNGAIRTRNFLRTVYFMPAVISNVAVGLIFSALMHPERGLINRILAFVGAGALQPGWLVEPNLVMFSIAAVEVWKWSGFTMVIFLAGLKAIPDQLYESGYVDGAGGWATFRNITFPLIMPVFNNALIMSIIGGLKVFEIVWVLTGGGPGVASVVINSQVFKAFGRGWEGEASAGGVILTVIIGVIAVSILGRVRKMEIEL